MKKFIILSLFLSSAVMADNLQPMVKCQGKQITMGMPEPTVEKYCKVEKIKNDVQIANGQSSEKVKDFTTDDGITPRDIDLSKLKFVDDAGITHICYYKNNVLRKCKPGKTDY